MTNSDGSNNGNSLLRCKFLGLSLAPLGLMSILSGIVILAVTELHAVYIWKGNRAVTDNLKTTGNCTPTEVNNNQLVSVRGCHTKPAFGSVPVEEHILAGLVEEKGVETLPIIATEHNGFLSFHREIQQFQFVKSADGTFKKEFIGHHNELLSNDKTLCELQFKEPCDNKPWPSSFELDFKMMTPQLSLGDAIGSDSYRFNPNTFGETSLFSSDEADWKILKLQQLHPTTVWNFGDYVTKNNLRQCNDDGWVYLNQGNCNPASNDFRLRWHILTPPESVIAVGKQIRTKEGFSLVPYEVDGYSEKAAISIISNSLKVEPLLPLSNPGVEVYLLRIVGYLLLWLGTHLLLSSLESSCVANIITSIRGLSSSKLLVYGNATATFTALLTIGVIWVTVQSVLAYVFLLLYFYEVIYIKNNCVISLLF